MSRKGITSSVDSDIDNYTKEQYNNFGWVRANNVLNAGYYRNFTENFAQAVENLQKYPVSKSGEFMIAVYDVYSDSEIADVVVFAKGTIEMPNITKIIKFNLTDESELDQKRRNLYEIARRGVQPKAGIVFDIYNKTDFISGRRNDGYSSRSFKNNIGLGVKRSRSEVKANPIIEFYVNEDEDTVTYIYSNGEKITEKLGIDKKSSEANYSRKSRDGNKVTMSKGEHAKQKANINSDKVFSRGDIINSLKKVKGLAHLFSEANGAPKKAVNDFVDKLWQQLNSRYSDIDRKMFLKNSYDEIYGIAMMEREEGYRAALTREEITKRESGKQKTSMRFTTRGLQLPKVVQTIIDVNNSISNPE